MTTLEFLLSASAGTIVGFTLGLVGGGGSILAVPLMIYLVGVEDPHVAIGTSAVAVATNALIGLASHARRHNVKWRCAATFALAGVVGAWFGAMIGKAMDGQKLLALFALLMLAVAGLMFRTRGREGDPDTKLNSGNAPRLLGAGAVTGLLSGFFGIGGGFLVVPGLIASTRMPILFAVGSSLVAVSAFGLTTAFSYASSGFVIWSLAAVFVGGGVFGNLFGARLATRLADRKGALNAVMAALIAVVAVYMLFRTSSQSGWL